MMRTRRGRPPKYPVGIESPEPRLGWEGLRKKKMECEKCHLFDPMMGSCTIGFMPGCTKDVV